MKPIEVSFVSPTFGDVRGLTVVLRDPQGRPPHELLRQLFEASNEWSREHPDARLLSGHEGPASETLTTELSAYLYSSGEVNGARLRRHLDMLRSHGHIHRFTLRPGAPVEGLDLVGRQDAIETLTEHLTAGDSVHLAAPRRYGKSSVLRRVARAVCNQGLPCVLVDLSSGASAAWLFVTVAMSAMELDNCRQEVGRLPELAGWPDKGANPTARSDAGQQLVARIKDGPWSFGHRLMKTLGEAGALLILDEFSVFLRATVQQRPDEAKEVAQLLAVARHTDPRTPQVLAGSEGLSSYIAFHDLGQHFEDLKMLVLPPLPRKEGLVLAEELLYGAGHPPSAAAVEAVLAEVGEVVPYFVHVLVDAVCAVHAPGEPLERELVERVYADRVLGPWGNFMFRVYRLGSQPYPSNMRPVAARLLQLIARKAEGSPLAELEAATDLDPKDLEALLPCLAEDYDLVERDGRWRMRSKVLRERWALAEAWLTTEA